MAHVQAGLDVGDEMLPRFGQGSRVPQEGRIHSLPEQGFPLSSVFVVSWHGALHLLLQCRLAHSDGNIHLQSYCLPQIRMHDHMCNNWALTCLCSRVSTIFFVKAAKLLEVRVEGKPLGGRGC